jgi:hypothetical protein
MIGNCFFEFRSVLILHIFQNLKMLLLRAIHYAGVGIQDYPLAVVGMQDAEEFSAVFIDAKEI